MPTENPTSTLAKWRELSGLTIEAEKSLQGPDRRAAIRKLTAAAETEIRAELALAEADAEFKSERTFLWEPIPAVCRKLEISQSALSRLLKELTGMTAGQLADKIRVEGLREKLRTGLIEHIQKYHAKPGAELGSANDHRRKFWTEIKAQRADPSFSLATHAIKLGFANYTRLYRACLLQYGKTPTQLEDEILREIAEFFECAAQLLIRRDASHYVNQGNPACDRYRKPYADMWAQASENRVEWMKTNRELFGLSKKAEPWL